MTELMRLMPVIEPRRPWETSSGGVGVGGAESLRVSALKYLNHAPVTLLPHVDVSVYQNEG